MKIRIERAGLSAALKKVIGATNTRHMQILGSVHMRAADGQLDISGTDLEVSVRTSLPCDVLEPGITVTPAKALAETLSKLEEDELELHGTEQGLSLRAGSAASKFVVHHPDDFPSVDVSDNEQLAIEPEALLWLLDHGGYAMSSDTSRPQVCGVHLVAREAGKLTAESTDGHRLARASVEVEDVSEGVPFGEVIVPARAVHIIGQMLDKRSDVVSIGVGEKSFHLRQGQTRLQVQLLEAVFPNFDKILPNLNETERMVADRDVVQHALQFARIFAPKKTGAIRLTASPDGLEVYATNPDVGEFLKTVPCEFTGDTTKIAFNVTYLLEAVSKVGQEVIFGFGDSLSPFGVLDPDNDDVTHVVMPMRL